VRIVIASDHAGFRYKELIRATLQQKGYDITDFGTTSLDPVDYPTFIRPAAEAVARGDFERGIILGGSGNGEAIVANRVPGIRCTVAWSVDSALAGRAHNDSNVLALGERFIKESELLAILDVWLTTPFEGGRHKRRIDQIDSA